MPVIISKEYTAVRSGSAVKNETCERCGKAFSYQIDRTVEGSGSSPFFLANKKAELDAARRAESHLAETLSQAIEVVPCPHCGWYQKKMVRAIQASKLTWMPRVAWFGLFGCELLLFGIHKMLSNEGRKPQYEARGSVMAAAVTVVGIWLALLIGRKLLLRSYDPNRGSTPSVVAPTGGR